MKMEEPVIGSNGKVVCPGVVCKCNDPMAVTCPRHGRPKMTDEEWEKWKRLRPLSPAEQAINELSMG